MRLPPGGASRAVCNRVYGAVARVVYSRTFPSRTKPQTGRLNKSPHTVHAIANRHSRSSVDLFHLSPDDVTVVGPFTVDNLITGFGPPNSIRCGLSQVRTDSLHCAARHSTGECFEVSTRTADW